MVLIASLANSRSTAKLIALMNNTVASILELMAAPNESSRLKRKGLDLIGNLAQWGDWEVYALLHRLPTLSTVGQFMSRPGYERIRATMIIVILRTHPTANTDHTTTIAIEDAVVADIAQLYSQVLQSGHAYDLAWAWSEPLYPLLKLCTGPFPPVHNPWLLSPQQQRQRLLDNRCLRMLAKPELLRLTEQVLAKSDDPWTLELALGVLLQITSFHTLEHSRIDHVFDADCPLCPPDESSPAPKFVALERYMSGELAPLLRQLKQQHFNSPFNVFWLARYLLVVATPEKLAWEAFCQGTHPRLNCASPMASLPNDVMPRILDFF